MSYVNRLDTRLLGIRLDGGVRLFKGFEFAELGVELADERELFHLHTESGGVVYLWHQEAVSHR